MKAYSLLFLAAQSLLLLTSLPVYSIAAGDVISEKVLTGEIAKKPNDHAVRVIAGFYYFDQGKLEVAETHFQKASQLTPNDPYDRAWLYMAQLRRNKSAPDKEVRAFLARKPSEEFVLTDILILLGDVTPEAGVEKATASKDGGNVCEAHYYAAQRLLADGQNAKAKAHLLEVLKTKKEKFWEYKSAAAWLKLL